jgi:hypothetical protein
MAMTLEEAVTEAAAKGLTHLSLAPVPSQDGKKMYWHASAAPSTGHQYVHGNAENPVGALMEALTQLPKAKKRTIVPSGPKFDSVNPPLSEMAQREFTAAVSDPTGLHPELEETIDKWLPKT